MQQISVFIENVSGTLTKVLQMLGNEGIQLRAISIADTAEYGICRLLCRDVDKAFTALKQEGVAASVTDVIAVPMSDEPGGAAVIAKTLAEGGLSLAYLYSFVLDASPVLVFRTDNNGIARELLATKGIKEIN